MIRRIVKLTIMENSAEDFLKIIDMISKDIVAFPGCRSLQILKAKGNKNIYFSISDWDDEIALNRYRNSEFFRSHWQEQKKLFSDKPEAWSTIELNV
jgi:quinol monooxygenase YgiN